MVAINGYFTEVEKALSLLTATLKDALEEVCSDDPLQDNNVITDKKDCPNHIENSSKTEN